MVVNPRTVRGNLEPPGKSSTEHAKWKERVFRHEKVDFQQSMNNMGRKIDAIHASFADERDVLTGDVGERLIDFDKLDEKWESLENPSKIITDPLEAAEVRQKVGKFLPQTAGGKNANQSHQGKISNPHSDEAWRAQLGFDDQDHDYGVSRGVSKGTAVPNSNGQQFLFYYRPNEPVFPGDVKFDNVTMGKYGHIDKENSHLKGYLREDHHLHHAEHLHDGGHFDASHYSEFLPSNIHLYDHGMYPQGSDEGWQGDLYQKRKVLSAKLLKDTRASESRNFDAFAKAAGGRLPRKTDRWMMEERKRVETLNEVLKYRQRMRDLNEDNAVRWKERYDLKAMHLQNVLAHRTDNNDEKLKLLEKFDRATAEVDTLWENHLEDLQKDYRGNLERLEKKLRKMEKECDVVREELKRAYHYKESGHHLGSDLVEAVDRYDDEETKWLKFQIQEKKRKIKELEIERYQLQKEENRFKLIEGSITAHLNVLLKIEEVLREKAITLEEMLARAGRRRKLDIKKQYLEKF